MTVPWYITAWVVPAALSVILSLHRSGMEEPAILGECMWGSIGFLISSADSSVPHKTDITWKGQILQGNLIEVCGLV